MSDMDALLVGRWTGDTDHAEQAAAPDPSEVAYMAYNGHSGRVFGVLKLLPAARRADYALPSVLRQGVVGGLEALRATSPADPGRPALISLVGELVERHVQRAGRVASRDLVRSLLAWSQFLFAEARLPEAEQAADQALELSLAFPELHGRVVLEKAACLSARGGHAAAHALLEALFSRCDLVADRGVVPEVALALGRAALLTGRVADFERSLFAGLRSFYVSAGSRRALFDLLRRAHRGSLRLLAGPAPASDKLVFAAHWTAYAAAAAVPPARRLIERAFLGGLYAARYVGPRPRGRARGAATPAALVTRAMGGLGDLLMMTPGLHALSRQVGPPVHLAVPRRYFPLFEGNGDVELLDIHAPLERGRYRLWFNLTDCPAARSESLASPHVRRNRIETFARALGVRGRALRAMDRRPRYFVSEREHALREAFFARHQLSGRAVAGVQIKADESYRDYPHMSALVRALARELPVLVFAEGSAPGFEAPGVVKVEGRPLREAFALAAGCAVLVSPDSAFLHLAAALDIPAVALFGPTNGRVRTADYPRARALDARATLRCVPCWRNEDIPCALTGLKASVCLGEIAPTDVVRAVHEALAGTAAGGRR